MLPHGREKTGAKTPMALRKAIGKEHGHPFRTREHEFLPINCDANSDKWIKVELEEG